VRLRCVFELKLRTKGKTIDEPAERFPAERGVSSDSISEGGVRGITTDINPISNIYMDSGRPPGQGITRVLGGSDGVGDERLTVAHVHKSHWAYSTGLVTTCECIPLVGRCNARLYVG